MYRAKGTLFREPEVFCVKQPKVSLKTCLNSSVFLDALLFTIIIIIIIINLHSFSSWDSLPCCYIILNGFNK